MHLKFLITVLLATCCLPFITDSQAVAQTMAPIMPKAASSLLLDLSLAGDRLVVAGERGHVLFSDDNGSAWQQASVPTTQMLTGIHFVDADEGWAVGHDGLILVSADGGENWRVQRDGIAVQQQINLDAREQGLQQVKRLERDLQSAADDRRSELELALEDARLDLEYADRTLEEPVFTSPLMDVWFQNSERGWAVGAFGTLVATRDGGQHWTDARDALDNPDEYHLNAITGDSEGRVFIAGEGGVMFRSVDGGASWETLTPFYEGSWFGTVYAAQHDVLLVFGMRGTLFRSTDFGATWDAVTSENTVTLAGGNSSATGEIVLAGAGGTVLHSDDGGLSFTRTMVPDRLSLSSGMSLNGHLIAVGQGGAKVIGAAN